MPKAVYVGATEDLYGKLADITLVNELVTSKQKNIVLVDWEERTSAPSQFFLEDEFIQIIVKPTSKGHILPHVGEDYFSHIDDAVDYIREWLMETR